MMNKENFMNWDNPGTALITGASSGIGAEFSRQLASQGFDVILVARRKERLDSLSKKLQEKFSINAEVLVADLSNITDTEKVISKVLELDNLDVLLNNAGFGVMGTFLEIDLKKHIDMINIHFTSPVMLCHAFIPGMKKRKRGAIINISSISAINKDSYNLAIMYTATKCAITIFTEKLKEKLRRTGIYVQALCPGYTYSEFHDSETMKGFDRDWIPKEEWMTAEEVVTLSLKNVKSKDVIFIPGELNLNNAQEYRKKLVPKYQNCKIL